MADPHVPPRWDVAMASDEHNDTGRHDGLLVSHETTTISRGRVHVADEFLHEPCHVAWTASMGRDEETCKASKRRGNHHHVRGQRYQAWQEVHVESPMEGEKRVLGIMDGMTISCAKGRARSHTRCWMRPSEVDGGKDPSQEALRGGFDGQSKWVQILPHGTSNKDCKRGDENLPRAAVE